MTLPQFLDASYALFVEDQKGINPLRDFSAIAQVLVPSGAARERVPEKREVDARNEQSMTALKAMLSQIPNAPGKKPRRAR